jgi:hypothetical protein
VMEGKSSKSCAEERCPTALDRDCNANRRVACLDWFPSWSSRESAAVAGAVRARASEGSLEM